MFEHVFKDLFPIFVYYSYLKRCLGSRRMEQIGDGGHWNSCFSWNLHDWEANCVETFFLRLQGKLMRRNVERAMQMAMKWGSLSVKSFYFGMVQGEIRVFLWGCYLEFMGSNKSEFFCMRSN